MSIVEVRPLPVKKWHGKKGQENFTQVKIVEVLYDESTGAYATGLDQENQEKYEKLMKVRLDNVYNNLEPHPYWSSKAAAIRLPNHTITFNTDIPAEAVKVFNMKASKKVANSWKEWEDGLWPNATHVIYDEEQEVESKAAKIERKQKANYYLYNMSLEDKQNIILCVNEKNLKGRSSKFVDVEIESLMETDLDELVKYIKMDKKLVYAKATVLDAYQKGIFTKEGSAYCYMGEVFAHNLEEAIAKFASDDNQQFKATILQKLNANERQGNAL